MSCCFGWDGHKVSGTAVGMALGAEVGAASTLGTTFHTHGTDHDLSIVDHLDPISTVMIYCAGPAWHRSNPGNMY